MTNAEIDRKLATFMGKPVREEYDGNGDKFLCLASIKMCNVIWNPSQSIAQAFECAEKMIPQNQEECTSMDRPYRFRLELMITGAGKRWFWIASFYHWKELRWDTREDNSPAMAICLAILAAKGKP